MRYPKLSSKNAIQTIEALQASLKNQRLFPLKESLNEDDLTECRKVIFAIMSISIRNYVKHFMSNSDHHLVLWHTLQISQI